MPLENNDNYSDLRKDFEVFSAKITQWMDTTNEYRRGLCKKIDDIQNRINYLPCGERKNVYDSIKGQLAIIWVVIVGVVATLFAELLKRQ